ncbi:hypothetical protein F511_20130 [Dorcoceras hygrometricum]|uniref:DUF4378 domain-containing protein n=1 Tax=Dorcoceras hygrometricum TaxID=472368 RepID=A0A2Z7AWN2_9LAMI|nr:hypothetical protein F511_20130 [Dorcoceras hygrometricum]
MGKEWLYWVGGGGGGSAGRRGRMAGGREEEGTAAEASAGCMCAVFQLFDLNNFQFPLTSHHSEFKPDDSFLREEATISKGVEAPRNSLDLEEPASAMEAASMSLPLAMEKEEENLNFPVGMKIKTPKSIIPTSALKSRTDTSDVSSECSSYSPGTKTPNLVARLMGLDLLPECTSPSNPKLKPKSHFLKNISKTETTLVRSRSNRTFFDDDSSMGTARSLPETPRISSSRRSDSEIHRLSLQFNKENACEEFDRGRSRRGSRFKMQNENASSPGHYARQIVKQVKENVSRRVGADITNRNGSEPTRRDENLVLLKPYKRNPAMVSRFGDDYTPSCSPKLRFLENTKNKPLAEANAKSPRNSKSSDYSPPQGISNSNSWRPKVQIFQEQQPKKDYKKMASSGKCKSSSLKKFLPPQGSDHGIKNKREESFVRSPAKNKASLTDKKCKKTPFSSDVFYISAPVLIPVKKDPSPPVTKLPQNQSQVSDALASKRRAQLSSKPSHSYKLQLHTDKIFDVLENVEPDSTNGCATAPSAAAEYEKYIQKILRRTRRKWHCCAHPLDPTIFHYLELFQPTTGATSAAFLSRRSDRKLIFQLVDELLGEILRPRLGLLKLASPVDEDSSLVDELCKKIEGFPAAKCEVLEDIDGLIEGDLCNLPLQRSFEEEGENIVCEIAGEITEWLMRETVAEVDSGTGEESRQGVADVTWRLPSGEIPLVGFIGPRFLGSSSLDTVKREWN